MADSRLSKAKVIFISGGPGSGKGTQCTKLVEKYGFNHLSSGDLLRDECTSGSELGQTIKDIMERGELAPLEIVLQLIKNAMLKLVDKNNCFLIDGYPREVEQGQKFEKDICPCACVVSFEVTDEVMRERLIKRGKSSGRVDDNDECIIKRLHTFKEKTQPMLDYYQKQKKLIKIAAAGTIDTIFKDVTKQLTEAHVL